nr:hypothetical protein GCM10017611_51090 [Rhodococcus wratislaviensis]
MIRVDRQERGPGLGHRPDGQHGFDRPRQRQSHHLFRADAALDQEPGEPVRPFVEVPVGHLTSFEGQRRGVRVRGRGGRQQLRQRPSGHAGAPARGRQCDPLARAEDVDVADRGVRGLGDGAQDPDQALGERRHRVRVEDVGGVPERRTDAPGMSFAVGVLPQGQLEVEIDRVEREVEGFDVEARQLQLGALGVLEFEHHLEQRRVRRRTGGTQAFHDAFERDVRVRERPEIGLADLHEQLGERAGAVDGGPEHEGVHEHADQVVELSLAAARDGGAHGDVVRRAQPRQQDGQRGVQGHEHGRSVPAGELHDAPVEVRVDLELDAACTQGAGGRAGPVRRQFQHIREVGQCRGPVVELADERRTGVVFVAEPVPLPQCVVGVLHRKRGPVRRDAAAPRGVRRQDVAGERNHREAVRRDVMHDHGQHVLVLVHPEQPGPHRCLRRHVEPCGEQAVELRAEARRLDGVRCESGRHLLRREDHLPRTTVGEGEDGAEGFVALDDVGDGRLQRLRVERAGEAERDRDVVRGTGRVELVDEPHPLLCERDGYLPRRIPRGRRRPGFQVGFPGLGAGGQPGDGRGVEHVPHAQPVADRGVEAGDEPGRGQRVPAEREEVVVRPHPDDAEQVGEHGGDDLLHRIARGGEPHRRRAEVRFGQRFPVEFAVDCQGKGVDHHHRGRHHVRRNARPDRVENRRRIDIRTRLRDHVAHQPVAVPVVAAHHDHRLRHPGARGQSRLHFAEFHPEPAQLHLEVAAPHVLEPAARTPLHDVARPVHARPRPVVAERVGDETRRGQTLPADVAAGHLVAGHVQLTHHPGRHRMQPAVEDVDTQTGESAADHRARYGRRQRTIEGEEADVHRGLCDAVHVHQHGVPVVVPGVPPLQLPDVEGFAAEDHVPQRQWRLVGVLDGVRRTIGLRQLVERRRGLVQHRHPFPAQQFEERVRRSCGEVVDQHQPATVDERTPQFPDGEVERVRVEQRPDVGRVEPEQLPGVGEQRDDAPM